MKWIMTCTEFDTESVAVFYSKAEAEHALDAIEQSDSSCPGYHAIEEVES